MNAEQLAELNALAEKGGGEVRIAKQHEAGKLSARERIDALLDAGSFVELDKFKVHRCDDFGMGDKKFLGDGVITGYGLIDGRQVFLYAQDFTVFGGSLSKAHAEKICKVMDLAMKVGAPVVGLADSGGARIQEGVDSLAGYADIFYRNVQASGVIPQISCILGPCAGGAVYSPAITDFIFMVEQSSYMFITGPDVIKTVTHEEVSKEDLGGARAHNQKSGVAHFSYKSDTECLEHVRHLLSYIPANNAEDPPRHECTDDPSRRAPNLSELIPDNPNKPYDIRQVIGTVSTMESSLRFRNSLPKYSCWLWPISWPSVGIVANQPMHLAGCLDIDASIKASRFVRFCDAFNIPLITFVDVPGSCLARPGAWRNH